MFRIIKSLSLVCFSLILASCASRSPFLSQPGIALVGPLDSYLHDPIWSPDGKNLAATHTTNGSTWTSAIYVINLSTNKIRTIEKTDYGNIQARSWSPNGNQIAFSSELGGDWPQAIWIADTNGVAQKRLITGGYDAAWSPDGNSLAVFSGSSENGNETQILSIVDLRTMNNKVVFSGTAKYSTTFGLAWSPDGTKLMFAFGKQWNDSYPKFANVDIYILEISTGELTKITNDGVNSNPRWSPDGKMISYINYTAGIHDVKLMVSYSDGRCNRVITPNAWSADWSPNGKLMAVDDASNLYTLDLISFLGTDIQTTNFICD